MFGIVQRIQRWEKLLQDKVQAQTSYSFQSETKSKSGAHLVQFSRKGHHFHFRLQITKHWVHGPLPQWGLWRISEDILLQLGGPEEPTNLGPPGQWPVGQSACVPRTHSIIEFDVEDVDFYRIVSVAYWQTDRWYWLIWRGCCDI